MAESRFFKSSKKCYDDLLSHNLINNKSWTPKINGADNGVILEGVSKKNISKKLYIKRYPNIGNDYAIWAFIVFKISKACGVSAPKCKLKSTTKYTYLFSIDMNSQKQNKPDTKYHYEDLDSCLSNTLNYIDAKNLQLNLSETTERSIRISIDRQSIASLILICIIFGLDDLSGDNLGILFCDSEARKKVKISLIDFTFNNDYSNFLYSNLNTELLLNDQHAISAKIKSMLQRLINNDSHELIKLSNSLKDNDYTDAFSKMHKILPISLSELISYAVFYQSCWDDDQKDMFLQEIKYWNNNYSIVDKIMSVIPHNQINTPNI